jgi:arylsulfatase A-like enzyme
MNITLITIDSLRADHVGAYGYNRDTTPRIDGFAEDAHLFENTVAHACATRPSFPSIFTSTQGLLYGGFIQLSKRQVPVAEPLAEAAYSTGGFHSNPYLSSKFGYDRGFDTFSDSQTNPTLTSKLRRYVSSNLTGPVHDLLSTLYDKTEEHAGVNVGSYYQEAQSITDEAIRWAETAPEPWFLWVHYMDPHHPYVPPKEHQLFGKTLSRRRGVKLRQQVLDDPTALSETDRNDLINLYDAEIRYVDHEVGRLLSEIDNSTWILTADHGEELFDHGEFGHKNRFYEEHIRVPLIIGGDDSGVHNQLVGLEDIPVTILSLAKVDSPGSYRGYNVFESNRDSIFGGWSPDAGQDMERAKLMYRTSEVKYIIDNATGEQRLYNLETDPDEQSNLAETHDVSEYRSKLNSFRQEIETTNQEETNVRLTKEAEERLQNLGYRE